MLRRFRLFVVRTCGVGLGLVLVLSLETSAWAQFTTARLDGAVVDSSGAGVVGAAVRVEQSGTGYTRQVTSGSSGEFLFPVFPWALTP